MLGGAVEETRKEAFVPFEMREVRESPQQRNIQTCLDFLLWDRFFICFNFD